MMAFVLAQQDGRVGRQQGVIKWSYSLLILSGFTIVYRLGHDWHCKAADLASAMSFDAPYLPSCLFSYLQYAMRASTSTKCTG